MVERYGEIIWGSVALSIPVLTYVLTRDSWLSEFSFWLMGGLFLAQKIGEHQMVSPLFTSFKFVHSTSAYSYTGDVIRYSLKLSEGYSGNAVSDFKIATQEKLLTFDEYNKLPAQLNLKDLRKLEDAVLEQAPWYERHSRKLIGGSLGWTALCLLQVPKHINNFFEAGNT